MLVENCDIYCYFDGCCEPFNPGGSLGMGFLVRHEDGNVYEDIFKESYFEKEHPENTSNAAEYKALNHLLTFLLDNEMDEKEIYISGDSKLVIKQMLGEQQIKHGAYVEFAHLCIEKLNKFRNPPSFKWIPREENTAADDLSKAHLIKNSIRISEPGDYKRDKLYFGKYKGQFISDIKDLSYFKWMLRDMKLQEKLRVAIEKQVLELEKTK